MVDDPDHARTRPSRKLQFLNVNGIRTAYTDQGQGEPMVLIHGGEFASFYNLTCWDPVVVLLAENFRVYAFDRLGQGATDLPRTDADYTMAAVVEHACGFVNAVGIQAAHLVGHSRGAYVALRMLLEQPRFARSLTIVDSNSILTGGQRIPFYERLTEIEPPFGTRDSAALEVRENSFSTEHVTADWLDELMQLAALPGRGEAHERFYKRGLRNDLFLPGFTVHRQQTLQWVEQGRLDVPTLLVWGLNDPSSPFEEHGLDLLRYLARQTPSIQMHVFNRAGHYCYREHPTEFVGVIRAFLTPARNPIGM